MAVAQSNCWIACGAVVAGLACLAFDLSVELGVAGGVSYVVVIWLAHLSRVRRATWTAAWTCTALTVVGLWFSPSGGEDWKVLTNRALAVLAIWVTAIACEQTRRAMAAESHAEELEERTLELERSNRDLDDFARSASHDLRAPLGNVRNLATWVLEDAGESLDDESRRNLERMVDRVELMTRMLNDLLNYSRIGRRESEPAKLPLRDVLDDVLELLPPPDGFEVVVEGELPTIHAPRSAIDRVLLNLVDNAFKHHDEPRGTVRISAAERGDSWEISVQDDGPGIPPQFHERVFEMFQSLRSRDETQSSGIGLAAVRKTLERYGGTIRIESDGRGTAFRFTWPRHFTE